MRTVTFTMEDALISPTGLAILTGAGLIEAEERSIKQHIIETVQVNFEGKTENEIRAAETAWTGGTTGYPLLLKKQPFKYGKDLNIYVMGVDSHGEVNTEPYLYERDDTTITDYETVKTPTLEDYNKGNYYTKDASGVYTKMATPDPTLSDVADIPKNTTYYLPAGYRQIKLVAPQGGYTYDSGDIKDVATYVGESNVNTKKLADIRTFLVDYYTEVKSGAFEIDITPDKFGGSFYLEASTLWRDQGTGQDLPAEFIIPNCRVQSNFTFTMASSGDPSSFTFTMDAFPDYTRYDHDEKVLARIQVIGATEEGVVDIYRTETWSKDAKNTVFGGTATKPGQEKSNATQTEYTGG